MMQGYNLEMQHILSKVNHTCYLSHQFFSSAISHKYQVKAGNESFPNWMTIPKDATDCGIVVVAPNLVPH